MTRAEAIRAAWDRVAEVLDHDLALHASYIVDRPPEDVAHMHRAVKVVQRMAERLSQTKDDRQRHSQIPGGLDP